MTARFVGRGEELAQLVGLFEDAERGVTRVALVTGEPGIGKVRRRVEVRVRRVLERGARQAQPLAHRRRIVGALVRHWE